MKINKKLFKLNKIEPYYFYFFILLNLIPVLSFKYFPTVDGPAHLYNSNLIVELLKDCKSPLSNYFVFNNIINPNCFGHFLLSLFASFLPGFISEKIVLLIYLIGLPLSLRHLFKTLSIESKYLIYLIFPFTYSFLFYYGFYNFNLGLIFFIFGISYWIKYQNNLNLQKVLVLAIFSTLICLSHLFVFGLFLIVTFLFNIQHLLLIKKYDKPVFVNSFKSMLLQLLALSFGLILMLKYMLTKHPENSQSVYLSFMDIFISLKYIMPAKGINYSELGILTKLLLYVFIAFIPYFSFFIFYNFIIKGKFILKNKIWLFTAVITLLLIFILPDYKGTIGFISSRLMLFFFIFLIIWLASQDVALWFRISVFLIVNYVNFSLVLHNYHSVSKGCELAEEIHDVSRFIEPNTTVLPILNSSNFIYGHISNYLGSDKPIIILENYEASLDHFPLKWNYKKIPKLMFGNIPGDNGCISWVSSNNKERIIDYVIIINDEHQKISNSCNEKINNSLSNGYELLYKRDDGVITIFKKTAPAGARL
jgi:hypothetical protein